MLGPSPTRYALLSLLTAVLTIALKTSAFWLTGSVGLLSDAAESGVNLVAALVALGALALAAKPADKHHPFGHTKAEYFASGVEGGLIVVAAIGIGWAAWGRLWDPQPLEQVTLGFWIALVATLLNGLTARILWRAGRQLNSITLRSDAQHLLTDVWTSVGVLVGMGLVGITGWLILDPLVAFGVAVNIVWTGIKLLQETFSGLLDQALPQPEQSLIAQVLEPYRQQGIRFHALLTRMAGSHRFISLHVLVPGAWTVQAGHSLCAQIEAQIQTTLPHSHVITHLEPMEDPASYDDPSLN